MMCNTTSCKECENEADCKMVFMLEYNSLTIQNIIADFEIFEEKAQDLTASLITVI